MTTILQNLVVNEVSLVKKGANRKKYYLKKADDEMNEEIEKAQKDAADAKEALEKAQADTAALTAKLAELEKATADTAEASKLEKAALEKASAEAVAKALELEKALAVEKEAKEVAAAVSKAAVDYRNLPEKAEVLGADLRTIRKSDSTLADRLEGLLRKLDALAKQALDPKGSAKAAETSGSANEEIKKRAQALVDAKVVPTYSKGVEKALLDDRDLYAAHEAEKNSAR